MTAFASDLPVAAIVHAGHGIADGLLADFALGLRQRGHRVRGVVQLPGRHVKGELVDLDDSRRFRLFQDLGSGSVSCSIDPGGVAEASVVLRRALDEGADLVVANRFGALEAAGRGFAAEMLAVMSAGVPLLTVVAEEYRFDWRHFTGGGTELPPHPDALETWFASLGAAAEAP